MTSGYPSAATENAVQANITARWLRPLGPYPCVARSGHRRARRTTTGCTKPAWEPEWFGTSNGWDTAWDDGTADSGFSRARNIYNGLTKANVDPYLFW